MGGSGAVPEPDAGGLRSVRLGVVSVFVARTPADGGRVEGRGCAETVFTVDRIKLATGPCQEEAA